MKITVKNLVANWDKIKGKMPDYVTDFYADTVKDLKYYDSDDDVRSATDEFIDNINEVLEEQGDSDDDSDDDEDFVEDGNSDDSDDGDDDEEVEDIIGDLLDIADWGYKQLKLKDDSLLDPSNKSYDAVLYKKFAELMKKKVPKEIDKKELTKDDYKELKAEKSYKSFLQFLIDNGYFDGKYGKTTAEILKGGKTNKKDKDKKDKDTTTTTERKPRTSNKTKKKGPKPPKVDTSKALPHWHRILKKFLTFVGTKKDVWRVREYVRDIQGSCNAKLKRHTPFVEIIQEIHDKLLPLANSTDSKVEIPKWEGLVEQVRQAFKDAKVGMSKKVDVNPYDSMTLSGVDNLDYLYTCEGKKKMRY